MSTPTSGPPSQSTPPAPETPLGVKLRTARQHKGAAAVAATSGLTAALLIAAFVVWGNEYLSVVYNADETSTKPHFAAGFLATGILEAAALVLAATIAFIAGLIAVADESAYQVGTAAQLLGVGVVALVAAAIPVGILYPVLALVPLFFAIVGVAIVRAVRRRQPAG